MPLRQDAIAAHPDFPWLDPSDAEAVQDFLANRGWLAPDERVLRCERAGEGNMNLAMRVATGRRSLIVKQARPWVEKYPEIPAPWERSLSEQRFYARAARLPGVAERMPALLASDATARVLVLEDLPGAADLSLLYSDSLPQRTLAPAELEDCAAFLRALHDGTRGEPDPELANRAMRALNHEHVYRLPLDPANGLALDAYEPGLRARADALAADAGFVAAVRATGARYLRDGGHLLHGDFFPGSWLRTARGVRFIDPEFCFYGDREFDLGVAAAHLVLARQGRRALEALLAAYDAPLAADWLARYAAVEVVRRLTGVAQLPIPPSRGWRASLLDASRRALGQGSLGPLLEVAG